MLKSKLKKLACITLAVSMVFSNVNMSTKAATKPSSDYSKEEDGFTQAVKYFYDYFEKPGADSNLFVTGDFEIANFTDNYEYSIVKDGKVNVKYDILDNVMTEQVNASCIWEEVTKGETNTTTSPSKITYLYSQTGNVDGTKWSFDVVEVKSYYHIETSESMDPITNYYAVNVRPTTGTATVDVTLPAYVQLDKTNLGDTVKNKLKDVKSVKCIELGDAAFLGDTTIQSVNIPDTYQRICAYAFTGCKALNSVHFVKTEINNSSSGNDIGLFSIVQNVSSDKALKSSNLHFVGAGAFAGCKSLGKNLENPEEQEEVKLPTVLTEGYRFLDEYNKDNGYAAVQTIEEQKEKKRIYGTEGLILNEDVKNIPKHANFTNAENIVKADSKYNYYLPYFMGQGVFRDCYGLKKVTIDGVNPFIPANTYAGCSGIEEICIGENVQNIYFGPACFAGADGKLDDASSLKSLKLESENLKSVVIGAYAFKNCNKLLKVTIEADLNMQNIYSKVQNTELYREYAFENAFSASESIFTYKPKTSSEFTIPEGFFYNSNVRNIELTEKNDFEINVEEYAFTATKCDSINLSSKTVELCTSSLYGLGAKECLIKAATLNFKGEPFSNTKHNFETKDSKSSLKKFTIDCEKVKLSSDEMKEIVPVLDDGEYKTLLMECTIYPSFYGAPKMKVIFTDSLKKIQDGSFASTKCDYYYYNVKKNHENFNYETFMKQEPDHIDHTLSFDHLEGIYFQGYEIENANNICYFISVPGTGEDKNKNAGKLASKIYADGKIKDVINNRIGFDKDNSQSVQPYTEGITCTSGISMIKDSKGKISITKGLENVDVSAKYADNNSWVSGIKYSSEEQIKYNKLEAEDPQEDYLGVNGFIVLSKNLKETLESGTKTIDIQYRNQKFNVTVTYIQKVPTTITASAVKGTEFVAGTEPKISDFEITNVQYNDDTTVNDIISFKNSEENVGVNHDLSKNGFSVSVVTDSGINAYTLGKNTVEITYKYIDDNKLEKTCTSTCIVTAEAPKVATMSAVLSDAKKAYYEGDILTAGDFKITAEYNDGNKDSEYAKLTDKYTIIPEILPEISESSKPVTIVLTDENGASTSVDINVNKIEPALLTVSYPTDVELGTELNKEDFKVTLHYNNGDTEVLGSDEFELHYSNLHVGPNSITVTYNKRPLTVFGLVTINVVEAPATEAPVVEVTEVPATEAPVEVTEAPAETTETPATEVPNTITDTETTAAPTATTSVTLAPATEAPTATASTTPATVAPTASTTPATAVPTATASTTPAPTATTIVQGPNPSSMTGQLDGSVTKATIGVGEKIAILNLASVTYTSSDSNILAVNNNIVTGKKVGKATVTIADANGNSKIYSITVKKAPKKIKASSKKVLKKGKTAKIKVLFQKGCYSYTNTFKSSNKKVATVDKTGVVTAKAKGSCKITVKTYNNKKATVKITVK